MGMPRRRFNWARISLIATLVIIGGGLWLRWQARKSALAYGHMVQNVLFNEEQAARIEGRNRKVNLFGDAEVAKAATLLEADWNPLGIDYRSRAVEMKAAALFIQLQLTLPTSERFRNMPEYKHFRIQTTDKTDAALRASLRTLVDDYTDYVGTR